MTTRHPNQQLADGFRLQAINNRAAVRAGLVENEHMALVRADAYDRQAEALLRHPDAEGG